MGPVVDTYARDVERAGQPADPPGPLEEGDLQTAPGSAPRRGEPSRAGAEDDEIIRVVHRGVAEPSAGTGPRTVLRRSSGLRVVIDSLG